VWHPPGMATAATTVDVVVGGVGQLYQGDLDIGRRAVEALAEEPLGPHVLVEEMHYGAIAVSQRLEDLAPHTLVLVGAEQRGRVPGSVVRRRIEATPLPVEDLQVAVSDAGTGYVTIDLVIEVTAGLGTLPPRTVVVEVEPGAFGPSDELSDAGQRGLERALSLVRAEVRRAPLLALADEIRASLGDEHLEPSPALESMRGLLGELDVLDRHGRWAGVFRERDRLRLRIGDGATGEGMSHLDWGLWWTLIEELDRLQAVEAIADTR
jgi:hypothetical protein